MIICKNCGKEAVYVGKPCPECNKQYTFDEVDIENRLAILDDAKINKQFEEMLECYHILADAGIDEAEIEFARILERGQITTKNLDMAMEYYHRAAKKHNPFACYKYSRLAARVNEVVGRFWLIYSAILGCELAYPELAEEFSLSGYEEDAHYYYSLAADCDDTASIVTLAKRFHTGVGVEQSDEHAKWYMNKLKFPPIYALKLVYQLRSAKPIQPPAATLKNYDGLLKKLVATAKANGYSTAHYKLCEILASRGDENAAVVLGDLLVRGEGCERDFQRGLTLLSKAAAHQNIDAYLALARLYIYDYNEKNIVLALDYCKHAGNLGSAKALELAGDIYADSMEEVYNIPSAVKYYDLAYKAGSETAHIKSEKLKNERTSFFERAKAEERIDSKRAYELYKKSAVMGHTAAMMRLAQMARLGIGTKQSRREAFSWYNKAALENEPTAFYPLGICYSIGFGVNLDYKQAIKCFMSAERLDDERAHEKILALLDKKVQKTAKRLYSTAMRLIHMKNFDAARNYLEIAAEINNPKAMYTLGCFCEFGIALRCDKKRAFDLYEKAYALSFRDPRSTYKLAILKTVKDAR